MKLIIVDVEADGQLPGINSMVCFGAVTLSKDLDPVFYGETAPISKQYDKEALAVSGFSRKEHEKFPKPEVTMIQFAKWLKQFKRPTLISDNPAFDFAWINYYMHVYTGSNPFGWSARRIGDLFCGYYNNPFYKWKKHRITRHTHNPVQDAKGNAEALLYLIEQGFKLKL